MSFKLSAAGAIIHETAIVRSCTLGVYTEIGAYCNITETTLDDYSYISPHSDIIYTHIKKFSNIAASVRINPGFHPMEKASLHHFLYRSSYYFDVADDASIFEDRRSKQVTIGNDTWIGHGVVIMPSVTIGDGAVIGSNAVVTKDVAAYQIVAGVPARPIRQRFSDSIAARMQALAWWNWSHARLEQCLPDFRQLSAEGFLDKYEHG